MMPEPFATLNPTAGHILAGVEVDRHGFLARLRLPQLRQIAPAPRASEDKRKLPASNDTQELRALRDQVQRRFEGAKAKNVGCYADYILGLHAGQPGITSTIILYSPDRLPTAVDPQFGYGSALVPWGQTLVAIDRETQLAARYEAANRSPETQDAFVAVYVCHGLARSWARQAFHDLNVLAVRPNSAMSVGMDARVPLTRLTREVEARVPFFTGRANVRRQLKASDWEVTTIATFRSGCLTLMTGIAGVRTGSQPSGLDDERQRAVV